RRCQEEYRRHRLARRPRDAAERVDQPHVERGIAPFVTDAALTFRFSTNNPTREISMSLELHGPAIAACYACATVCDRTAGESRDAADPRAMARCIALSADCAEICRTAGALLSRGSDFADMICATCAEICEACSVECGQHETRHCRQCADAC